MWGKKRVLGEEHCILAAGRGKKQDGKRSGNRKAAEESTGLGGQHVYLFDIVASFCAGLYEHDIELLSPLLASLGGDLSAQGHAARARWTHTQVWKETPQRQGERETERETRP